MIDVLRQPAHSAAISGSARRAPGNVYLASERIGTQGVIEFGTFAPTGRVLWLAAEIDGLRDQATDSVRIRIGTDSKMYYMDESDSMKVKPVTAADWDSQYSSALALASLDLWTQPQLRVQVCLMSTRHNVTPNVDGLTVLMDLPAWEGAVAQAVRRVVGLVGELRPILLHTETLTEPRSQWKLGNPHTEIAFDLTELLHITIDGVVRTGILANGIVTLNGAPAKAGQLVHIALRYHPQTSVRRVGDVRILTELPAFVVDELVRGGGMNGSLPPLNIAGLEVRRRMTELRIQVRGVATRQADAFAMRAAIQERFGGDSTIVLDSGRSIGAAVIEIVEVSGSGTDSMPVAVGTLHCPMHEYTSYRRVSAARRPILDGDGKPMLGPDGQPTYRLPTNTITISNPDSGIDQVLDVGSSTFTDC